MKTLHVMVMLLSGLSLALAGCYTSPHGSYNKEFFNSPEWQQVDEEVGVIPEYRLGFGDVLEIRFFNNAQFNDSVTVRPDGRITLERVGDIYVAGMTPSKLDSLITKAYSRFLRKPEVTVIVRKFGGYQFFVVGEVNKPGGYPLQRNMTILQALAMAGGANNHAQLKSVIILRPGPERNIQALKVDVSDLMRGNGTSISRQKYYLRAQDVVYVPKSFISDASQFLKQIYDGFLPPLDIYLRALWWKAYR